MVENDNNKTVQDGNGVNTSFSFTFQISEMDGLDIKIYITDTSGNTGTALASGYLVTLNDPDDLTAGGYVTYPYPTSGTKLQTGEKITIARVIPITSDLDLENTGPFIAQNVENAIDKVTMIAQQLNETSNRTLKADISVTAGANYQLPAPVAGKVVGWDATATKFYNYDNPATAQIAAAASADLAEKWATEAEDTEVTAGKYSAYHWSQKSIEKFNEAWLSVKDYGAEGDGIANDSQAIILCLAAASTSKAMVFFPHGTYNLNSTTITLLNSSNITLFGTNAIIKNGIIHVQNCNNIEFYNLEFEGSEAGYAIGLRGVNYCKIHDCKIHDFIDGIVGYAGFDNNNISIYNNEIYNMFIGSDVHSSGYAIGFGTPATYHKNLFVYNNHMHDIWGDGSLLIQGTYDRLKINKNYIHDTAMRGINLFNVTVTDYGEINCNTIKNIGTLNYDYDGAVGRNGIFSNGIGTANIDVKDNIIINVWENSIEGTFRCIDNNYVENTGYAMPDKYTPSFEGIYPSRTKIISNNIIRNPLGTGIRIPSSNDFNGLTITNNTIINDTKNDYYNDSLQGFGIAIECSSTNKYFTNVTITGNTVVNKSYFLKLTGYNFTVNNFTDCVVNNNSMAGTLDYLYTNIQPFVMGLNFGGLSRSSSKNQFLYDWSSTLPDGFTASNATITKLTLYDKNVINIVNNAPNESNPVRFKWNVWSNKIKMIKLRTRGNTPFLLQYWIIALGGTISSPVASPTFSLAELADYGYNDTTFTDLYFFLWSAVPMQLHLIFKGSWDDTSLFMDITEIGVYDVC